MENQDNNSSNEIVDNSLNGEQQIDYKAEYEKIIAERERAAAVGNFESLLKEKYVVEDENVKNIYGKLDNNTLQIVGEVLKALKLDVNSLLRGGKTPTAGSVVSNLEPKKPSFKDAINNK